MFNLYLLEENEWINYNMYATIINVLYLKSMFSILVFSWVYTASYHPIFSFYTIFASFSWINLNIGILSPISNAQYIFTQHVSTIQSVVSLLKIQAILFLSSYFFNIFEHDLIQKLTSHILWIIFSLMQSSVMIHTNVFA